jgi:hypothetical protein
MTQAVEMDEILLTFDVEWAPEFAIDFVAERLADAGVAATWLVTDANPAIERLRECPELFELGIHPNFRPGTTHGNDARSVLDHCMQIVPDATTMRSHSFTLSSHILIEALLHTPIRNDLTVLLPYTPVPHPADYWWEGRRMVRFPTFWEDDAEFERPSPTFDFAEVAGAGPGLKTLNLHPLLVYLNASDLEPLLTLRKRIPDVRHAAEDDAADLVSTSPRARSMFEEALHALSHRETNTVSAIARRWVEEPPRATRRRAAS